MPSPEETKAMQAILDKLNSAQSSAHSSVQPVTESLDDTQKSTRTANVSPDAQEMYNILNKLQNATESATARTVSEKNPVLIGNPNDTMFGVGEYNIILEKKKIVGYDKTYYHIVDQDNNKIYNDISLFESAMAIVKQLLFKQDAEKIKKIVQLDEKYDHHLCDAAVLKSRAKTLTESARIDILEAKRSDCASKMSYLKKQIKSLI